MSYTRSFTQDIIVHYSGTVSYPASEHGGTKSYSGSTRETVQVEVHVDTDPFDASVEHTNKDIKGLTASVVATEAAEVVSIRENAIKVGNTIIEGFFNNVRFEISSQVMELTKRIDSLLITIKERADQLKKLKSQMEVDYNRTASRYSKIFGELNKELENRIFTLDEPVFDVSRKIDKVESRQLESDLIDVVAIAGTENALLQSQLESVLIKKRASLLLSDMSKFIASKQSCDSTLQRSTINDARSSVYYAPVCYFQANDNHDVQQFEMMSNTLLPDSVKASLSEQLKSCPSQHYSERNRVIEQFFSNEVANNYSGSDDHSVRVGRLITQLFNNK